MAPNHTRNPGTWTAQWLLCNRLWFHFKPTCINCEEEQPSMEHYFSKCKIFEPIRIYLRNNNIPENEVDNTILFAGNPAWLGKKKRLGLSLACCASKSIVMKDLFNERKTNELFIKNYLAALINRHQ